MHSYGAQRPTGLDVVVRNGAYNNAMAAAHACPKKIDDLHFLVLLREVLPGYHLSLPTLLGEEPIF
jgi:hypothetical protein